MQAQQHTDKLTNHFHIAVLGYESIHEFMELQETVWNALAEGSKHHLKRRTVEDLIEHLETGMPIIGVRSEAGKLVAHCLLTDGQAGGSMKYLEGYPLDALDGKAAVIHSLSTHPEFKGLGLAGMIMAKSREVAEGKKFSNLLAKVAEDNTESKSSFLKNGFQKSSEGVDPTKGYAVSYFSCQLAEKAEVEMQEEYNGSGFNPYFALRYAGL